jgi:DDE superfamily endonuclease
VDQSGFYLLPAVVRTYAPVGQTPVLQEELSRDHLSAISAISLEGKLYMMEQERAFKAEDVVRFLKHLLRQRSLASCSSYGTALRSTGEGRSKTTSAAELPGGLNSSSFPATPPI